jgi:hypothetical protein
MPLGEVHLLLLAADDLDDAVGEVLLGVGRHALGPAFVAEENRPVLVHLVLSGNRRLLIGVDVLGRHPLRNVFVFLELVLIASEVRFLGEHRHLQRAVELRQHVPRLVRQAERLVRRQVPPLLLACADVVDGDQNAEDDQEAHAGERAIARLTPAEHLRDFRHWPAR